MFSSYGKSKLFCHYFNNEKDCPFEGRCIFAHEESPECRFGQTCERVMCMFSHDERDVSDTESDNENDEEDIDENDDDTEMFKITDIEPSLQKVEDAMEKVQSLTRNISYLILSHISFRKHIMLKTFLCGFSLL